MSYDFYMTKIFKGAKVQKNPYSHRIFSIYLKKVSINQKE